MYNNRDNVTEAFENGDLPFTDGFRKKESDLSNKTLPDCVEVDEKIVEQIKIKVLRAKKNNFQARPTGYDKIIFLDKASRLFENIENGKISHEEALKTRDTINKDIKAMIKRNLMKIKLK